MRVCLYVYVLEVRMVRESGKEGVRHRCTRNGKGITREQRNIYIMV